MSRDRVRRQTARGLLITLIAGTLLACPGVTEEAFFEIPSRGRVSLDLREVEGRDRIVFLLGFEDEGAGSTRTTRVVGLDGRRLDTRVERVAGRDSTFRLDVAGAFLRPGKYLIEVDGQGARALNLRRYVVEVTGPEAPPAEP